MESPADDALPALPPIRTALSTPSPQPTTVEVEVSASPSPPKEEAAMESPADDALPALPPIRTALSTPSPQPTTVEVEVSASPSPPKEEVVAEADAEEEEPSTPTSEESRLRPPAVCPPAPRKPLPPRRLAAAAAGKRKSSPVVFVDVPRDLAAVFRSLPPKKRIRACSSVLMASSHDLVDFYGNLGRILVLIVLKNFCKKIVLNGLVSLTSSCMNNSGFSSANMALSLKEQKEKGLDQDRDR
uniref:Uncharacterized protein n=1 Tax=Oryza barthii TaxID=65489 RepID=A0A0D3H8J2_9ORYZ